MCANALGPALGEGDLRARRRHWVLEDVAGEDDHHRRRQRSAAAHRPVPLVEAALVGDEQAQGAGGRGAMQGREEDGRGGEVLGLMSNCDLDSCHTKLQAMPSRA